MARRYCPTVSSTARLRSAVENPRSRPAMTMLAASRLTSHSHGPGSVSSKSLTSKTSRRSGLAYRPKLSRWASPQACTVIPVTGVPARSAAMPRAAPRKKANGDDIIRPCRMGTSSGTRVFAWLSSRVTGSGRSGSVGSPAWEERGTVARACRPRAALSSGASRAASVRTMGTLLDLIGALPAIEASLGRPRRPRLIRAGRTAPFLH